MYKIVADTGINVTSDLHSDSTKTGGTDQLGLLTFCIGVGNMLIYDHE